MENLLTLKGAAISKYGSCVKFAREMGWNRSKAARILNGVQDPTIQDIKHRKRRDQPGRLTKLHLDYQGLERFCQDGRRKNG